MTDAILKYIKSIRNTDKKDYATRYAIWLMRSPEERKVIVPPQYFHLSDMAAQAVRLRLYALTDGR